MNNAVCLTVAMIAEQLKLRPEHGYGVLHMLLNTRLASKVTVRQACRTPTTYAVNREFWEKLTSLVEESK